MERRDEIVEIAHECNELGCGPDATNEELFDLIWDCIGGRELNDIEQRLAVIAYENGVMTAKNTVWYDWLSKNVTVRIR